MGGAQAIQMTNILAYCQLENITHEDDIDELKFVVINLDVKWREAFFKKRDSAKQNGPKVTPRASLKKPMGRRGR